MSSRDVQRMSCALLALVLVGIVTGCGHAPVDLGVPPVDETEPPADVVPRVAISPLSGPPGAPVQVVATGFPPLTRVLVGVGPQGSEFGDAAEGTTDADGTFVTQVAAEGGPGMALAFAVRAEGQPGVTCPDLFYISDPVQPAVAIAPLSGPPGTPVQVVATGFPPLTRVLVGVGPRGSEFTDAAEGTTGADGSFVAQVAAEGGSGMALAFAVRVEGQPGVTGPDLFYISDPVQPAVAISPLSGPPGTPVRVVATGFPPLTRVLVGVGPQGSEFGDATEGTTGADGTFVAQVAAEGGPGMALVFAVRAEGQPGVACPDLFYITEATVAQRTYSNAIYDIALEYPAHWQPVPGSWDPALGEVNFAAEDGFFLVGAVENPGSIDEVATGEAHHALLPYGSQPTVESLLVAGQEARLIWPSADQYPSMNGQAALIVRYPWPVSILDHLYNFFVLYADADHIRAIAQTVYFLGE